MLDITKVCIFKEKLIVIINTQQCELSSEAYATAFFTILPENRKPEALNNSKNVTYVTSERLTEHNINLPNKSRLKDNIILLTK